MSEMGHAGTADQRKAQGFFMKPLHKPRNDPLHCLGSGIRPSLLLVFPFS